MVGRQLGARHRQPVGHEPAVFQLHGPVEQVPRPAQLQAVERELLRVDLVEHQGRVRGLDDPVEPQPLAVEADRRVEPARHEGQVVVDEPLGLRPPELDRALIWRATFALISQLLVEEQVGAELEGLVAEGAVLLAEGVERPEPPMP